MKVGWVIQYKSKVSYKTYEPNAYKLCVSLKKCHIQLYQFPFVGLIPQLVSYFTFPLKLAKGLRRSSYLKFFFFYF